jgi:hypothetical protein
LPILPSVPLQSFSAQLLRIPACERRDAEKGSLLENEFHSCAGGAA